MVFPPCFGPANTHCASWKFLGLAFLPRGGALGAPGGARRRRGGARGAPGTPDRVYVPSVSSNFEKVDSSIVIALPRPHTQPRMPVGNSVAFRLSYDLVVAEIQH